MFHIKDYIKSVIGDGALYNKFNTMIDNLYKMFMN
jgi:hypothetical protein